MILRDVRAEDLLVFFEHQRDETALQMAAFPSRTREAFLSHWHTQVLRPENAIRTIEVDGAVAGYVSSWSQDGRRLVAYWIGREHWGQGIASRALNAFLKVETTRPLQAFVAETNVGSIRVLEKCGFRRVPEETQRHEDGVVELLLTLD